MGTVRAAGMPIGFNGAVTVPAGTPLIMGKTVSPSPPPGAGLAWLFLVAGTNPGTAKLIVYAGTSSTPVVVADNIGGGF